MNKPQRLPWDNPRFRNWIAIIRAEKAVAKAIGKALAPIDLKINQLDVLMNLYRHPDISQHELARRLLVGRSNVTMLLPQLEKEHLVSRQGDASDRRVMRLRLTPRGETVLLEALEIYTDVIDRVMSRATAEECATIGRVMGEIADTLDEE